MSKIEWTQRTWNPILGCSKVTEGCKNCYAMRIAWRLQHNPKMGERYKGLTKKTEGGNLNWTGHINVQEEVMYLPFTVKKPTLWFVNSMSDLFHPNVPMQAIAHVFAIMAMTPAHTYQVLTKHPDRMKELLSDPDFMRMIEFQIFRTLYRSETGRDGDCIDPTDDKCKLTNWPLPNVWLGTSVENQQAADERIPHLLATPAGVRFLSCEPLLGPVDLTWIPKTTSCAGTFMFNVLNASSGTEDLSNWGFTTIDWVIAGGESGPNARPMHPDWVRSLRDQCQQAGVPFFFKQWGEWSPGEGLVWNPKKVKALWFSYGRGPNPGMAHLYKLGKKEAGKRLDGREWVEMPRRP